MSQDDPRTELAQIAASLRAYLEWQQDSGSLGIPRGKRPAPSVGAKQEGNRQDAKDAKVDVEAPRHALPQEPPTLGALGALAVPPSPPPPAPAPAAVAAPVWHDEPRPSPPVAAPTTAPVIPSTGAERLVRLEQIREEVRNCAKCELATTRTNTVFSRGNPESKLCFIGEAPGADEDAQGLPFVGRAGQLLDKMIAAMGLSPEGDVYVCNIIKCRPPGNRRPTPDESNTCIPYLHEQLALVRPRVIVAMGNTAVAALLQTTMGITKLRGQWKLYRGSTLVMPTYHPSYLLRPSAQQQQAKREAWDDLQLVMKELGIEAPKRR
ncbi:uracil-DNA glycosylase [Pendulispora rubella]|uniref:Type-4 uracil-DNA glycosylase n=1 Tax=Pendulispora rubella TaxID=2741070 RepID=A0ABZ2LAN2_9BACT